MPGNQAAIVLQDRSSGWLDIRAAWIISAVSLLWGIALITNFDFNLIESEKFALVYNDMAQRLLRLDMTIDPNLITYEGFLREGRTYTYFGIFPALVRVPAILAGAGTYPLARISCLTALWIISFTTVRTTQAVFGAGSPARGGQRWAAAAIIGAGFSGPVVFALAAASVWHEIIAWAAAGTAIFNWVVVRRVCRGRQLRPLDFNLLALAAGCVLLTRVTCGLPLYAGLGLLLAWPAIAALPAEGVRRSLAVLVRSLRQGATAIVISLAFVALEAAVNQGRWGSPFTPVPMQYYGSMIRDTGDRLARFMRHGSLDVVRIPFAAMYYGLGIKLEALSAAAADRFDGIEGPRTIGILCAPWMFVCAAFGVRALLSAPDRRGPLLPLAIANAIGLLLALAVPWLSLRYTFDGWGFLVLFAATGAAWLARREDRRPGLKWTVGVWPGRMAIMAALTGVLLSHATLLRYKINYYGTAPATRFWLSQQLQPLFCSNAPVRTELKPGLDLPLVTPSCPPLW
jgi:hypothetical protein